MQAHRPVGYGLCLMLVALLALSGCAAAGPGRWPVIVATSTIVGDLASEVAGNEAIVEVLMPIGADPSTYDPTPRQTAKLLEADLIVASGLGLEAGLVEALADAERDGVPVLRLGEESIPFGHRRHARGARPVLVDGPDACRGGDRLIADRMDRVCPGRWTIRAIEAEQTCYDLDRQIRCLLYRYVPEQGRVVPDQAGLGYFAERYGFGVTPAEREPVETVGLMSVSMQIPSEPRALPSSGVSWLTEPEPAIGGASVMETPVLPRALTAPSVILFVDSLGAPGTGAETYQQMMLTNAERVVEAGPVSFVERAHGGA